MKLSEIAVGKEYAVVPSWTYNNKSARDIDKVQEGDVVKATVVELTRYEYEPSNRKSDPSSFVKAEAGNRSVGILVKAIDKNGAELFWTSRLADIVAEWSLLEPRWAQQKQAQLDQERLEQERREREQRLQQQVQEEVERSRNSVIASAKELLGDTNRVEVTQEGYGLDRRAVVTFTLKEFEKLIELAYAGKE